MKITTQFTPEAQVILGNVKAMPLNMAKAIAAAQDEQHYYTIDHIQQKRMTGDKFGPPLPPSMGVLRTITNQLRGSLRATKAAIHGNRVESSISTNVQHAGIHEFGGRTAPHEIASRKARSLRFMVGGQTIFRRRVQHPGSTVPARAPIRRGIEDRLEDYEKAISNAVVNSVKIT